MTAYSIDSDKIAKVEFLPSGTANVAFDDLPAVGQSLLLTGLNHATAAALASLTITKAISPPVATIQFEASPPSVTPPDTFNTAKLTGSLTIVS